jgi:hypothetical protein
VRTWAIRARVDVSPPGSRAACTRGGSRPAASAAGTPGPEAARRLRAWLDSPLCKVCYALNKSVCMYPVNAVTHLTSSRNMRSYTTANAVASAVRKDICFSFRGNIKILLSIDHVCR